MDSIIIAIIIIEGVAFLFQFFYFLERPSDSNRKYYLILLLILISYNVSGGLIPNDNWEISMELQRTIGHATAIGMSMYFVFYIYRVFKLEHMRWLATRGVWIFLFAPFILLFVVPLYATGDLDFSQKLLLPIPTFYAVWFISKVIRHFIQNYRSLRSSNKRNYRVYIFSVSMAMFCWALLPIVTFFKMSPVIEHVSTNLGLMFMTGLYIHSLIIEARSENRRLQRLVIEEQKLTDEKQSLIEELKQVNQELQKADSQNKTLIKKLEQTNQTLQKTVRDREATVTARTEELRQANEQKATNFVNIVHEIKTPLTLLDNNLDEYIYLHQYDDHLSVIRYSVDKLITDVLNLFDIERYERGIEIYDHRQVSDVSTLLLKALDVFQSSARKQQVKLSQSVKSDILIDAHPDALLRIIRNLIDNALKYTPSGGEVHVELSGTSEVLLNIIDNGIGISANYLSQVTKPYFRAAQDQNVRGIGMGLALVENIVRDIGGTLDIDSQEGRGTAVTISLPPSTRQWEEIPRVPISIRPLHHNSLTVIKDSITDPICPNILVVEDDHDILSLLTRSLSPQYNVYVSSNAEEALEKLEAGISRIDMIISDVMMPGRDGFEFYETLADQERFAHVPFIFLTAKTDESSRLQGLNLGAIYYLSKPFKVEELRIRVATILNNAKRQRAAFVEQVNRMTTTKQHVTGSVYEMVKKFEQHGLSPREIEVAELITDGRRASEIAGLLFIAQTTVEKHTQNIYAKVGVSSKVELISRLTK